MKILHVVGARPNYMKVAPILRALSAFPDSFRQVLVHTGQHYDEKMSEVFFGDLELPSPDYNLGVGSGSHAWQTGDIMAKFEPVLEAELPDWLLVAGDVNSTLACALVAAKMGIPVAHVEAGLRSFDRTMPEEVNRVLTDQISSLHFTSSPEAKGHLLREGIGAEGIHFVGNTMIDSLSALLAKAKSSPSKTLRSLEKRNFVLVTLHRPGNVDEPVRLRRILSTLRELSGHLPVVFPAHPRTLPRLDASGGVEGLILIPPLSYLEFVAMEERAALIITDSGGVQEESTWLGVPCLTLRPNTERPITLTQGTNRLCEVNTLLELALETLRQGKRPLSEPPPLWDGRAAERIAEVLLAQA
ncbi:MAG: UDP-N-acetylglucosamine 2-epimerase (non-hydrolyzing) [Planctomycetes bacterium]|nr:UDP-N-acetylglucosamine 2-epimerase (non-hydrolyzing) [Planctomycetota bacterium]